MQIKSQRMIKHLKRLLDRVRVTFSDPCMRLLRDRSRFCADYSLHTAQYFISLLRHQPCSRSECGSWGLDSCFSPQNQRNSTGPRGGVEPLPSLGRLPHLSVSLILHFFLSAKGAAIRCGLLRPAPILRGAEQCVSPQNTYHVQRTRNCLRVPLHCPKHPPI